MHGTKLLLIKAGLFLDSIGHVLSGAVAFEHNVTEFNAQQQQHATSLTPRTQLNTEGIPDLN